MLANDIRNYRTQDYISHHGILGQKWGIRRFQDKNGKLTAEGKTRLSDNIIIDHQRFKNDPQYAKRLSDAADIGIEALVKSNIGDTRMIEDMKASGETESLREWFLFEDQTYGMPIIADMANRGKNKEEILNAVKEAKTGDLAEFGRYGDANNNKFIDAVIEVKKAERITAENNAASIKIPTDFTNQKKVLSEFNKLNSSEKEVFLDKYFDKLLDEADKSDAKIDMKASEIYNALFNTYESSVEHSSTVEDDDYIEHHGILGQKHGIKNGPPYPLGSGDHSPAEKKAASQAGVKVGKSSGKGSMENVKKGLIERIGDKMKANKVAKQRKAALDKAREAKQKKAEEAKAAEQHEVDKKKALESGDYNQIQKYAHETSTADLKAAIDRADKLKELNRKVVENTPVEPTIWDQISDAANKIGTATNAASKGIEAWNKVATVWNTFADPEAALPEIGKNFSETKEKLAKDKAEKARKAYVDQLTKTNDPDMILKNQEFFTNEEIKGAQSRLANIDSINKIKSNRANGSNSSDSSNSSNSSNSSSESNNNSDDTLEQIRNKRVAAEEKIKEDNKQKRAEYEKANEKRNAWKKEEQDKYWTESKEAFNKEVDRLLNPQNDRSFKIEVESFTSNIGKKYKPIVNTSVEEASTKSISDSSALSNSIFDYLNSVDSDWRMKQ